MSEESVIVSDVCKLISDGCDRMSSGAKED